MTTTRLLLIGGFVIGLAAFVAGAVAMIEAVLADAEQQDGVR